MSTRVLTLIALSFVLTACASQNVFDASRNGNLPAVKKLIEQDKSLVNAQHEKDITIDQGNRWTPLHYAAAGGHTEMVTYLLAQGADPLASARGGWTPLHAARQADHQDVEKILVDAIKASGRPLP